MKPFSILAIAAATLFMSGCDSSSSTPRVAPPPEFSSLQVLHASPDAPAVNVLVDGTEQVSGADYKAASGLIALESGTYSIQVDGILPSGSAAVIGPVDLTFDPDTLYTIAAVNNVASIEPVVISQPIEPVSAGSARLFVLHATAGPGGSLPVDVYVTAPGADLTATAPTGTFDFKETLGPLEVAAADYQVRVTLAGDPMAVAYDSGTITLNDGDDLRLAAVPNTSGGPAAVTLVAVGSGGASDILDVQTPTALRVGHLSPDTGQVDVLVDGAEYLADVPYPAVTGFDPLPAATYNVAVTAANNPGVVPIGPVDLTLSAGTWYSVLAVNFFNDIEALILDDDPRPVATNAKVRIVHAAPSEAAASVDIYVTAVGADINNETPTLTDIPFLANTGYLALDEGDYDVTVTVAGTKTAAIGPATISIANGGVYTAIARDPEPGSMEFGLIVLADTLND
ncbi:MAG: DUF4397 domain-containing protein [Gammaproteobacteria bacterium]|nr:DUF4397 domain-containing protein [Gammaproteobacteria bacterium]